MVPVHHSPVAQPQSPIPIKATPARTSRVVGPRPFRSQRIFHARREPTLAVPKPAYPLPTWLTHFEDYEQELLAEFCPPSEDSSPLTPIFPPVVGVGSLSEDIPSRPSFNLAPLTGLSDSGYIKIEAEGWCPREDGGFDKDDTDYDPFEFDTDLDFWSDYASFRSESSAPASHRPNALDWSAPFQGQVGSGEGYSRASAVTILEFPLQVSPSPPPSSPHVPSVVPLDLAAQLSGSLPWSIFTNPFTGAPITTSPAQSPVVSVVGRDPTGGYTNEIDADRFLMEMEEGWGFFSPRSLPGSFEAEAEEWCDRFDLTGYTFPVLAQQPQSRDVAAGFEPPPLAYTAVIPLPDTEEDEDTELGAVVISMNPSFG